MKYHESIYSREALYEVARSRPNFKNEISEEIGYAIQRQISSKLEIGGWKLGGTNFSSLKAFNTDGLYFGPIEKRAIITNNEHVDKNLSLDGFSGELEIIAELKNNINDTYSNINSRYNFFWGIEYPVSQLKFPDDGLPMLIADCSAAGYLVVGPQLDIEDITETKQFSLVTKNETVLHGQTKNLTGSVEQILEEFERRLADYGLNLTPGDYVATGGMSACMALPGYKNLSFSKN